MDTTTLKDDRYEYHFGCHGQKELNRANKMFEKEKGTIVWIDEQLRPDDVFYDIGANIGTFTILAGRRLGDAGRIVAFEPHIPNASSLIGNILLNGLERKVQLVTSALTNREGYNRFNYHSMHAGASTSQYGRNSYEGDSFEPQFVEIKRGCTIDELCRAGLIAAPDMVKIDVDGLDFEVLDGMRSVMASPDRPRSIQIELGTESTPKITQLCGEMGYVLESRHWTQAGLDFIAQGHAPEEYPHYGIFKHRDCR